MKKYAIHIALMLAMVASYAIAQAGGGETGGGKAGNGAAQVQDQAGVQQGDEGQVKTQDRDQDKHKGQNAKVDDQTLERQVRQQLSSRPDFQSIQVSVQNAVVDLTGSVPKKEDRKEAAELAKAVPGVSKVREHLSIGQGAQVGEASRQSREETGEKGTTAAGAASAGAGGVSGAATGAPARGQQSGQPGATGAVGSQAGQNPPTGAEAGQQQAPVSTTSETGGMAPDQLKAQLQQAFQSEPTLSACNITSNVTVDSIELAGTCPSGKEKQTARRMAQSLAGNRRVVDRITVSGKGEGENQEKNQGPPPQF